MQKKLPVLSADRLLNILFGLGFRPKIKRGSHLILVKGGRMIVVPIHKGRDISVGTLFKYYQASRIP